VPSLVPDWSAVLDVFVDDDLRDRVARMGIEVNEFGYDRWGASPKQTMRLLALVRMLYRNYFRVDVDGIENVPEGRALLIGNHSGQLAYDGMVLDESRSSDVAGTDVENVLFEAARQRGLGKLWDQTELQQLQQRILFGAAQDASLSLPDDLQEQLLRAACVGKRSFAQLARTDPATLIARELGDAAMAALQRLAPKHVELPDGRRLRVQYERGKAPWIKSRLQDFFGMARGPRLGDVNLVLHLLAPNQRAVQVTTDLTGFWERHYPALRKQLMRRYPRHAWPEDPISARPPAARSRRR